MPNRNVNETANPLETTEHDLPALYTSPEPPPPNLQVDGDDSPETVLQKIIYEAARANITQVWVANRLATSFMSDTPSSPV